MGMKGGKTALKLPIFGVILGHDLLNSVARKQFCMFRLRHFLCPKTVVAAVVYLSVYAVDSDTHKIISLKI